MLNVIAQTSAAGAKAYFSKSDYYSEGQELVGNWGGKGATLLGTFGEVEQREFDALCDNQHPQTGKPLTAITRSNRRVGYDFTWSAPKSASVVHALTGDDRILSAFRASVQDTMKEMEVEMQARVRKDGADTERTTSNLAWAEFTHLTSRPVNGLPCPQLHSHVFAFNATYDVAESKWKAGQFGKIKGDAYYWQAVQQARFANNLQRLGYGTHKTKDAFEIDGVPAALLKKFSLRTLQIEKLAEKLGITDPKAKAKLGATTREAKLDSIPYPELVATWEAMLSSEERLAIRSSNRTAVASPDQSLDHLQFAVDHSFERASVIDERRLLTLALRHGNGSVTPEGVRTAAKKAGLLRRQGGGKTLVTTEEVLQEERKLLAFAVIGKGSCQPASASLPSDWQAELHQSRLSGEQQTAVSHIVSSSDRLMILRGVAGSGKTTLTTEAVGLLERAGKPVVMLAPSANASRGVLRSEGFDKADTLARFLADDRMQATSEQGVIWLDEAGLVGVKSLVKLCEIADTRHARIVLSGDKRQMASVERGTALRTLEDIAGLKVAEVTDIRRQSGEYKSAVSLLSNGKSTEGLQKLDDLGWVKTLPAWDPYKPVAVDYVEKFKASKGGKDGVLIVCPTHSEGEKITARVREQLREQSLIAGEERRFVRLIPLQWTQAQRNDREHYTGDEILQLHRTSGDFKAGERVRAEDMLASAKPPNAAHFATYGESDIAIAQGDVIKITAGGKTKDDKHKLNNGSVYSVRGFTLEGDITLSNGWVVDKGFAHLDHGFVSTAQASQGRTVDHVLVCQSAESYPAASKEGFYVAVSRGRKSATVFTDDKRELKEAVQRSNPRLSATELVQRPEAKWWESSRDRLQRLRLNALVAARSAERAASRAAERATERWTTRRKELAHAR